MAIDPVCGMEVDEDTAVYKSEYRGTTYYFCSPGCKADFDSNPEAYLPMDRQSNQSGSA